MARTTVDNKCHKCNRMFSEDENVYFVGMVKLSLQPIHGNHYLVDGKYQKIIKKDKIRIKHLPGSKKKLLCFSCFDMIFSNTQN